MSHLAIARSGLSSSATLGPFLGTHPQIHSKHERNEEEVEGDEGDGLPQVNLGGEVDAEERHGGDEVEGDVADEGGGVEREWRGVDGHEAHDEGGDEGAGGEYGGEAGAVVAGAEGGEGREEVGRAVAEGEERHGGHAWREVEEGRERGGHCGEVVLRGLDEDVEVERYQDCQDRQRSRLRHPRRGFHERSASIGGGGEKGHGEGGEEGYCGCDCDCDCDDARD